MPSIQVAIRARPFAPPAPGKDDRLGAELNMVSLDPPAGNIDLHNCDRSKMRCEPCRAPPGPPPPRRRPCRISGLALLTRCMQVRLLVLLVDGVQLRGQGGIPSTAPAGSSAGSHSGSAGRARFFSIARSVGRSLTRPV